MQEKEVNFELIKHSLNKIDEASSKVDQLSLLVRNLGTRPEFENVKPLNESKIQLQAEFLSDALSDAYEDLTNALDMISLNGGLKYDRF